MSNGGKSARKWIGICGGLAGIIAITIAMIFYLESVKVGQDAQGEALATAIDKLVAIVKGEAEAKRALDAGWIEADQGEHKRLEDRINDILAALDSNSSHMAVLTVMVRQIEKAQSEQFSQRESRFEELENEHKKILAGIHNSYAGIIEILLFLSVGGKAIPGSPPLNKTSLNFD